MDRSVSVILLILLSALPTAAGEIAIASVSEQEATLSQSIASGATDGNDFLFVWSDVTHGSYDCRAARVTREGVVLDRGGIPVPAYKRNSVVWTGTSYLILWDKRDFPDETHSLGIYGFRIGREGTIIDGPRLVKEEASISSVISDGTHVVIEYRTQQASRANERHALFLDAEANIVADVLLAKRDNVEISGMAWNGTHFVAAWVYSPDPTRPGSTLEAIRFDIHGTLDAAPRQLLSDPSTALDDALALASDGDSFLLVTHRNNGLDYGQRMSPDLIAIGAPQELPWLSYSDEGYHKPDYSSSIFWNGSSYLRFGYSLGTISVVRMDRDGRTIGKNVVQNLGGPGSVVTPVAAANGRDLYVGWTQYTTDQNAGSDVFGALVSVSTLQSRARTLLSMVPAVQKRPLVASGGTNLLTVWEEGSAVYARRLVIDGSVLDAAPLRVAEDGTPKALVFNGSDYLAFWSTTSREAKITRLPRDGTLRMDGGATLPNTEILGAASDGVVTLLLSKADSKLQATRILADGSPGSTVTITSDGFGRADIAAGNGAFLVVWEADVLTDPYGCPPMLDNQVHGARVSSSLAILDTTAFNISLDPSYEREPAAAWNGREWLVVWRSCGGASAYGASCELRGRLVSPGGVPQGDDGGTLIARNGRLASVAWDGSRYALTWWDNDSFTTAHAGYLADLGRPLIGDVRIQHQPFDFSPLRLAPVRPGLVATAYARVMADATYREVTRAFVNLLTSPAPIPRRHAVK